jgi:hypothetical protein
MRIRGIRLPDGETFACSRRDVKNVFASDDLTWVSFGSPIRSFRFDSQVTHRPRLVGPVVASLQINRDREAHLCVYPISLEAYSGLAKDEMRSRILPILCEWLRTKKSQPTTATLGHYEIIAEWIGSEHRCHELRFL